MNDYRRESAFINARSSFLLWHVHPRLAFAPRGLRAHGKSVESRTRSVSYRVTLAQESRRTHLARVYSWHKLNLLFYSSTCQVLGTPSSTPGGEKDKRPLYFL